MFPVCGMPQGFSQALPGNPLVLGLGRWGSGAPGLGLVTCKNTLPDIDTQTVNASLQCYFSNGLVGVCGRGGVVSCRVFEESWWCIRPAHWWPVRSIVNESWDRWAFEHHFHYAPPVSGLIKAFRLSAAIDFSGVGYRLHLKSRS